MKQKNQHNIFYLFSLIDIKLEKGLDFGKEIVIENSFHNCKRPSSIDKIDIKKIVLSSKESYGNKGAFKNFIGYISNVGIIPLYKKKSLNECIR